MATLQATAERNHAVSRVLGGLLIANLAVVVAKVVVGFSTNSLAVFGDATHSSVDAVNNILGLAVMRVASKAPDDDHPYGHAKFETLGALLIVIFLSVTIFELLRDSIWRLRIGPVAPALTGTDLTLLVGTLAVNIWVTWFETRAGRRLESEILLADAAHTRADVLITLAVIGGLLLARRGYAWADPVLAIVVTFLVARIGVEIVRHSMPTLVDARAMDQTVIQRAAEEVQGVRHAYHIRSRTAATLRFAELTIAVDGSENVEAAHRIADAVEDRLRGDLALHEIVIHVEPC